MESPLGLNQIFLRFLSFEHVRRKGVLKKKTPKKHNHSLTALGQTE